MGTKMKVTSYGEQYQRRVISDDWQPDGFYRYPCMRRTLESMPVLGGPQDTGGVNPDRYREIGSLEESFPAKR